MADVKPSNPKDSIGAKKAMVGLVPDIPDEYLAFLEGALKYGRFNWRAAGVRVSIYHDAIRRHLSKFWNGEDADKKTRVKHLLSIIACCKIMLDAERCGKLEDDRPPKVDMEPGFDESDEVAAHLKELFKDYNPKQWTINDEIP
jgi:hypothetical protein